MIDTQDRLANYIATFTLSASPSTNSGTISVSGMANDGTWFVYSNLGTAGASADVYITINSGSFTWTRYDNVGTLTTKITVMRT